MHQNAGNPHEYYIYVSATLLKEQRWIHKFGEVIDTILGNYENHFENLL